MPLASFSSPHLAREASVRRMMVRVLLALIPGAAALTAFFGWGVLYNIVLAGVTALAAEALMLRLRRRPVGLFLGDASALLTGVLLALALPPLTPWWITVLGTAFALVFGKHLYGGLGYNPFNPAMVGYVVLLVSFPREMTRWPLPTGLLEGSMGALEALQVTLGAGLSEARLDALTSATPLDQVKTQLAASLTLQEIRSGALWGRLAGAGWEWVNLAFLAGGLYLWRTGAIGWQIPAGVLGALGGLASFFWLLDPDLYPGAVFHLLSGGAMLGAFFIATDPVSAATTPRGRIIYGLGIGALIYVIRTWGGYPEGVAFGVLLMNLAAPLIDQLTRPRVYGH